MIWPILAVVGVVGAAVATQYGLPFGQWIATAFWIGFAVLFVARLFRRKKTNYRAVSTATETLSDVYLGHIPPTYPEDDPEDAEIGQPLPTRHDRQVLESVLDTHEREHDPKP
ncbi:MAG: hypothetical protein ACOYBP_05720 [Microbacteriaceae bacterium]